MSYAHKRLDGFTIDWITAVLVGLLALFQAGVLYLVHPAVTNPETTVNQSTSASQGGSILLLVALEIALLLILWRGYKRLPERWKARIRRGLKTLFYPILWLAGLFGNYQWVAFNVFAFGMGVIITSVLSLQFAPIIVIGFLVAFTVYDHLAVNLSDVMGDLMQMSSNVRLPNFIVVPTTLAFDLQDLRNYINGERDTKPDSVAFVIGVGDFVFPSLLVGSAFISNGATLPVVGATAGTAIAAIVLRDSIERSERGLPALPWLNTGAIGGFLIGAGLSAQPFIMVLGL